ncbi:hypothetical protein ETD86_13185 [Nonomuraea turkmeniaca]|uniref:Novel STAND NTPase 1 domain-containing protein n=1 Tax=Nonomuraea turkmeniaca TaxID=103838 RepID=A0A5S4FMU4_9ACTN|nr:trypsin-like peptidase domain-containing protein [Nonomuraea turkmeniaca]TMR21975.1 hypothetical protein ETD86_13185 [Nonomuraea turkmeniaca]
MRRDFSESVVRVLDPLGRTAGAGFVISAGELVLTCAHVVIGARSGPGQEVDIGVGASVVRGLVLADSWRDPATADLAVVRLETAVDVPPLALSSSAGAIGADFATFGYPDASPTHGLRATGVVLGPVSEPLGGSPLIQLGRSNDVTTGFSGGPVIDLSTGMVIGMIRQILSEDRYGRQSGVALATPAEGLREAWPPLWLTDVCPYRPLAPFEEADARFFFGREAFVRKMVGRLRRQPRFLAVIGPSGSGKSSAVRAGLIPELREGRVPRLAGYDVVVGRPADLGALEGALPGFATDLPAALRARPQGVVLVLDQFEELFVAVQEPERSRFVAQLGRLLEQEVDATLVLVMRDDFYSRLAGAAPEIMDWVERGLVNVPSFLGRDELIEIVTRPAEAVRLRFEPGLAEAIVDDAIRAAVAGRPREPGLDEPEEPRASGTVLPLLEFALGDLWKLRRDGVLLWDVYRDIGGVTGGLANWAEDAYRALPAALRETARQVFTDLVHLGDELQGIPDSRWQRRVSELVRAPDRAAATQSVIAAFADRRLLVTAAEGPDREETVELIHDVLLREWGRLQGWLKSGREFLVWRQELDRQVRAWRADPSGGEHLLRGAGLAAARVHLERSGEELSADERAFIETSSEVWEAEEREQRLLKETAKRHERSQLERALRERASQVMGLLPVEPASALALAVRTLSANLADLPGEPPLSDVAAALRVATSRSRERRALAVGAALRAVAIAPDGRLLAGAGDDRLVRLWTREGRPYGEPLTGHDDAVNALCFSPDGRLLASADDEGLVRLWTREGQVHGEPLEAYDESVNTLCFSPDGGLLIAGGDGGIALFSLGEGEVVRLDRVASALAVSPADGLMVAGTPEGGIGRWELPDGSHGWDPHMRSLDGDMARAAHDDFVSALAFSPMGGTLASAGGDGAIRLWTVGPRSMLPRGAPLSGHEGFVTALAFGLNGDFLVSGGQDATIRIWDPYARRQVGEPWAGHADAVTTVAASQDGTLIVSGGLDGTVRLWDWLERQTEPRASGRSSAVEVARRWDAGGLQARPAWRVHREFIHDMAVSADGRVIATGSDDRTLRLSGLDGALVAEPYGEHGGSVRGVAISPDGRLAVSASSDTLVRRWSAGGLEGLPFDGHTAPVNAVAFHPDGSLLASASDDGSVRLSDLEGRAVGGPFGAHGAPVTAVAFHPDGSRVVSGGRDGTVRIWVPHGRDPVITCSGHEGEVESVAISPDGSLVVSGAGDRTVRLWDIDGRPVGGPFIGHDDEVRDVAFSPDGTMVVSAAQDATVRVWALDGTPLGPPLRGHGGWVTSVAVTPDGRYVISAGMDSTLRLWELGTWRDWLRVAHGRLLEHPELGDLLSGEARRVLNERS